MPITATVRWPSGQYVPVGSRLTIAGTEYAIPDTTDNGWTDPRSSVGRIEDTLLAGGFREVGAFRARGDLVEFDVEPLERDA